MKKNNQSKKELETLQEKMMYKEKQKKPPSQIRYERSKEEAPYFKKWLDDAVKKRIRN